MIPIPTNAVSTITGYVKSISSDLWFLIALGIGIPLAFWIFERILSNFGYHDNRTNSDLNRDSHNLNELIR